MYRLQMKLQRIISFLCLGAAALTFIYSLGLVTDIYFLRRLEAIDYVIPGAEMYYDIQPFNRSLTVYSIVLILLSVACLVAGNASRRKYYVANYCTTVISSGASIFVAIWGMINVHKYKEMFLNVEFSALENILDEVPESVLIRNGIDPTRIEGPYSTFWFDACYFIFPLVILASVLCLANMIFKTVLMYKEKQLLKEGEV